MSSGEDGEFFSEFLMLTLPYITYTVNRKTSFLLISEKPKYSLCENLIAPDNENDLCGIRKNADCGSTEVHIIDSWDLNLIF